MSKQIRPYGSWPSSITPELLSGQSITPSQICLDGTDVYWLENRPAQGGRLVIMRRNQAGAISETTPEGFNVRNRVHEYGGGAYTVCNGIIYFVNFSDNCIYKQKLDGIPQSITNPGKKRYADLLVDSLGKRLICVCEDHENSSAEPVNTLIGISLETGGGVDILHTGYDFYASPALSSQGDKLAFIAWRHPYMPWDKSELLLLDMSKSGNQKAQVVCGGTKEEALFQPVWDDNGGLYFVSDRNGWWNLYYYSPEKGCACIYEMSADFGTPLWVFGLSCFDLNKDNSLICSYTKDGRWYLARLADGGLTSYDLPYSDIGYVKTSSNNAYFIASGPQEAKCVVKLDISSGDTEILKSFAAGDFDKAELSQAQVISYPTSNGQVAFGNFYAPTNVLYKASENELPPLIVKCHGGPTSQASTGLDLSIQFWTNRGYAVFDVNYRGSSGFGRAYRQSLNGQWGKYDLDDCISGAQYLADQKMVDRNRLIIRGGSAGGYTVLAALTFSRVFKAGASYYGIGNLEDLVSDTHKFESRYLDSLVGPYPETKQLYKERSPINFIEKLASPVIFFQGLEDKVVPPGQAEQMVEALDKKGLPVAYVTFPEEGHGFRQAPNIKRSLEAEFYFYSRIFSIPLTETVSPVEIRNL